MASEAINFAQKLSIFSEILFDYFPEFFVADYFHVVLLLDHSGYLVS